MDAAAVWKEVDKWTKYAVSWLVWGMSIALPVILVLLMIKGTKVGSFAESYVPVPTAEYMVWGMLFGMYWLYKKAG